MVGARVRRQQVIYAEGRGLSRRRACALLSVARSKKGYVSRLVARVAPVLVAERAARGGVGWRVPRRIQLSVGPDDGIRVVLLPRARVVRPGRPETERP